MSAAASAGGRSRVRLRYAVVAVYVACLVAASAVPTGGGLAATGPLGVVGVDKWFHLAGYAGLGAAAAWAGRARTPRSLATAALFAVGVGAGVETMQATLPYRAASAADGLVNAAGAAVGVLCWLALVRWAGEAR